MNWRGKYDLDAMTAEQIDALKRWRSGQIAHGFKELFRLIPLPRSRIWRWMFLNDEGEMRRAGEIALADLRDYCGADPKHSSFHPDPLMMARIAGRREVFNRIVRYLNLDETHIENLRSIDDVR